MSHTTFRTTVICIVLATGWALAYFFGYAAGERDRTDRDAGPDQQPRRRTCGHGMIVEYYAPGTGVTPGFYHSDGSKCLGLETYDH